MEECSWTARPSVRGNVICPGMIGKFEIRKMRLIQSLDVEPRIAKGFEQDWYEHGSPVNEPALSMNQPWVWLVRRVTYRLWLEGTSWYLRRTSHLKTEV